MKERHYLGGIELSNYGFYITTLILRGPNKKDAKLSFNQGLNVISGASDTGKTYIFECLNYIFGSRDKPKDIEESEGYTDVIMELKTYEGKSITLKRSLIDKNMYIYECGYKEITKCNPYEIKNIHDKNDKDNISSILLKLCKAPYKNIIKNRKGHTESFTYRDFVRLTLIGETKIIESFSPIYIDGSNYTKTRCESAFRTIMTGFDDSGFENIKTNEISKVKMQGKLELVDSMITNIRTEIEELKSKLKLGKDNTQNIETNIEILRKSMTKEKVIIKELENQKESLWNELQQKKHDKMLLEQLKNRFTLLRKNYESDIERLDFIDESEYYINQLIDINCPICKSVWNKDMIEEDNEIKNLNIALSSEKEKVEIQLQDLISTINDIDFKINIKQQEINDLSNKFDILYKKIDNEIKPMITKKLSLLENLFDVRDSIKRKEYKTDRLEELSETRGGLITILNQVNIENPTIDEISDSLYNEFTDIIKDILLEWKLEEEIELTFDVKTMDIIMNGKKKGSFGKGFSALLNSAFILALMKYSIKKGLPHSRVIVLDSPLTTYKGKDEDVNDKDDSENIIIVEEVNEAFYSYLSKQKNEMQIIILDNVEPPKEIQNKIIYYHFTKNHLIGRYGFIPR